MFKRILVPLDGSSLAEAVLPQVQELAKALKAELFLVRAAVAHVFPGADPSQEEVDVVQKAEAYVAEVAGRLHDAGIPVHTAVRYGEAAEEILDHIGVNAIDLVAMFDARAKRPQPVGAGERRGPGGPSRHRPGPAPAGARRVRRDPARAVPDDVAPPQPMGCCGQPHFKAAARGGIKGP